MALTLADIAKQIGVSTATISRVINHESNVSPETCRLVEEALVANNYNYRPRRKSTSSKNTDTILIIAGQITNPVTVSYIDGIRDKLSPLGKRVLIGLSDYSEVAETDHLQYAKDNGFAGIFMLNVMECDTLIGLLKSIQIPVILVNRYLRSLDIDLVTVDNFRCGYMATQYLIQHGHTKIAHLAGPKSSITCQNRTGGFLDAMDFAGIPLTDKSIYYSDRNYEQSGFEFGKKICEMDESSRFTAVFCTSGLMAVGLIDAIRSSGLRIPEDISVICNDDNVRNYKQQSELTIVAHDPYTMGVAAAELYLDRMQTPNGPPKRIVYPPVLTQRDSVQPITPQT